MPTVEPPKDVARRIYDWIWTLDAWVLVVQVLAAIFVGLFVVAREVDLIIDGEYTFAGYLWEATRLMVYALSGSGAAFVFWCIALRHTRFAVSSSGRAEARRSP